MTAPGEVVAEFFELAEPPTLSPRYNIAPTQPAPAVVFDRLARGRRFKLLRWGLIPPWAKGPGIGSRMINARAETVAAKPAYRSALRYRRCLIVADGFYEWRKVDDRTRKQPYYIHMGDHRPFAFAGLWEHWEGPDGSGVDSCTVITTVPNELIAPIHDRMPVILDREHYDRWLDPEVDQAELLTPLLSAYAPDDMEAYPIGTHVNDPSRDSAACIEPLRP